MQKMIFGTQEVAMISIYRLTVPAVLIGVMLIGLPAFVNADSSHGMKRGYESGHRAGGPDGSHMIGHTFSSLLRHAKELALTDEQVTKLKSLMIEYKKTRILDKADVKLARVDVRALAHDEKADMAAIESAVQKLQGAKAKMLLDGIRALRAATATLTPEQREKWRAARSAKHTGGDDRRYGETSGRS
jgi:Spy/CpxP family protein refolding chaperone